MLGVFLTALLVVRNKLVKQKSGVGKDCFDYSTLIISSFYKYFYSMISVSKFSYKEGLFLLSMYIHI
jgi:hypothetical protein